MNEDCLVCGRATRPASHGGVAFRDCTSCGFARLADPVGRSDYWTGPDGPGASRDYWTRAKKRYFEGALSLLETKAGKGRLLDIGGGIGFFAELAAHRGWDAYSFDVSPMATDLARERLGEGRALASLRDAPSSSFDAVTLWCVVAHTPDPAALLKDAAVVLRPGGVVWVTTPNFRFQKPYAAVRARVGRPIDFASDDHILHFTPEALSMLLQRVGFSTPSFNYCGITEMCLLAGSADRSLLALKRVWNRAASTATRFRAPNFMSELQALAAREASS